MSFLSSIFLLGLPLIAVPVAIHLLSRRRQEVVKWAAMQFLMDSNIRRRKIWRLDDLILMLLRTAAVLGVVLALARPLWHGSGAGIGLGRDVVFIWDVSMSMERAVDGAQTSFDRMVEKTKVLLDQMGPRDTVRGLVTIGRGKWLAPESLPATSDQKQALVDGLNQVGVTEATADWTACFGTATRGAPPRDAKARMVVILTDGQSTGWPKDASTWQNIARMTKESKIPLAIEVHNVSESVPAPHNLAVDKLTTSRHLLGIGESQVVEAEVRNHGQTTVAQASIDWMLNDVSLGKSSVGTITPGQSRQVSLKHSISKAGIDRLSCVIDIRDDLPSDNRRSLIVETVDEVPLLLVDDSTEDDPLKSDKGYLLAALGYDPRGEANAKGSGLFRVTTIGPKELAEKPLSSFRAVVFANTPDLDDVAVTRLTDFVRSGGGLWLALGDRTRPESFNNSFFRSGAGLCPWPIAEANGDLIRREKFVAIHPPEKDHPATVLLSDTQRLDIDRVKVFQRFPFVVTPAKIKVPVLLQSSTGEALAIEGFFGRGRVFVQSIPMGVRWSSLPLTQAYVPMVHEWVWYLIQPTANSWNLQPGDPLQLSLPQNEHVREIELKRPDGGLLSLTTHKKGDQLIAQSRDTLQPGAYAVRLVFEGKDDQILPFQVARAAEESTLDLWPKELTAMWGGIPEMRINPQTQLAMPTGTAGQRPGEPIWTTLLTLVAIAFILELWLAPRIARKRFAGLADSNVRRPTTPQTSGNLVGQGGAL